MTKWIGDLSPTDGSTEYHITEIEKARNVLILKGIRLRDGKKATRVYLDITEDVPE